MKLCVRKDVYEEIMKSYIARWGYPGHYKYKYLEPDKGYNPQGISNGDSKKNVKMTVETVSANGIKVKTQMDLSPELAERYKKGEFTYKSDNPKLVSISDYRFDCAKKQKPIETSRIKPFKISNNEERLYNQALDIFKEISNVLKRENITCKAIQNKKVIIRPKLSAGHLAKKGMKEKQNRMRFLRFIPEIIEKGKLAGSQLIKDENGNPSVRHDLVAKVRLDNKDYMVSLIFTEDKNNVLHLTIFDEEIQKSIGLSQSTVANCVTSLEDTHLVTIANTIFVCGMDDLRTSSTRNNRIKF